VGYEVRGVPRVLLEVAGVEKVVKHPDAEQGGGQVDVQSRDPLQRLVEHDDGSDERKEAARRIAADDHGVAAVENDDGDGEAAETLHDRAGAGADARELVRRSLETFDRAGLTAHVPGARVISIPDTGHHLELENPEAICREIRTFLR